MTSETASLEGARRKLSALTACASCATVAHTTCIVQHFAGKPPCLQAGHSLLHQAMLGCQPNCQAQPGSLGHVEDAWLSAHSTQMDSNTKLTSQTQDYNLPWPCCTSETLSPDSSRPRRISNTAVAHTMV